MTIVDTIHDAHYGSRAALGRALAALINEEARELEAAGVDVIQLDEPAFNVYMDEVRDWGIEALDAAVAGLRCRTVVHICYGYGIKANIDWKQTLGGEWRQYERTFPLLARGEIGGCRSSARAPGCRCRCCPSSEKGRPPRRGRRCHRRRRDARGGGGGHPPRPRACRPERLFPCTNCGMVPLAARWRAASSAPSPRAPRSCGASSAAHDPRRMR